MPGVDIGNAITLIVEQCAVGALKGLPAPVFAFVYARRNTIRDGVIDSCCSAVARVVGRINGEGLVTDTSRVQQTAIRRRARTCCDK